MKKIINKKSEKVLTNKLIVREEMSYIIFVDFMSLMFCFVGILLLYIGIGLTYSDMLSNKIISIIMGLLFLIVSLSILISVNRRCINILKGNYVIIEDVLKDKDMFIDRSGDSNDKYYLYFEKLFKKYNHAELVKWKTYNSSRKGDIFYIVFTKSDSYAFNSKKYKLPDYSKLVPVEELHNYTFVKEFKLEDDEKIKQKENKKKQ